MGGTFRKDNGIDIAQCSLGIALYKFESEDVKKAAVHPPQLLLGNLFVAVLDQCGPSPIRMNSGNGNHFWNFPLHGRCKRCGCGRVRDSASIVIDKIFDNSVYGPGVVMKLVV